MLITLISLNVDGDLSATSRLWYSFLTATAFTERRRIYGDLSAASRLWYSFPPDAIHTPGIANVAADGLSRVFAPKGSGIVNNRILPSLRHATQSQAPIRNEARSCSLQ